MNGRKATLAALALALLAAGGAGAQGWGGRDHGGDRHGGGHTEGRGGDGGRGQGWQDRGGYLPRGGYDRGPDGRFAGRERGEGGVEPRFGAPPAAEFSGRRYPPPAYYPGRPAPEASLFAHGGGSWRRGQFLPQPYWGGAALDARRYHLRGAPPGYGWYAIGREAYLVQRSTGLILDTAPGLQ